MKSELLACSDVMRVEHFFDESNPECKNLAYIFTPSMNRNLNGNAFGGEVFSRNGFETIAFKISNDDWFQSIPDTVFESIKTLLGKRKYLRKVAYGSSMGGYAAIAFSKLLDSDQVIVFSPQYCIDEPFDLRWSEMAKNIEFRYRITLESIKRDADYWIYFDNKHIDNLHVQRLLNLIPNLKTIKLPYTGHPSTHYLAEVGLLKEIINRIAAQVGLTDIEYRKNRRQSKSYLNGLSTGLYKAGHLSWALAAIESALQIDPKAASYYIQKSRILEKMGDVKAAISTLREAILIDPENPSNQRFLDRLLSYSLKNG
jgi:tetratricopeptide (TPR) repeat protein